MTILNRDNPATDADHLAELLSEIGEDAYCASWMDGIEEAVWTMVVGRWPGQAPHGTCHYGQTVVNTKTLGQLCDLALRIGGWVRWRHAREPGESGPVVVPMAEWLRTRKCTACDGRGTRTGWDKGGACWTCGGEGFEVLDRAVRASLDGVA